MLRNVVMVSSAYGRLPLLLLWDTSSYACADAEAQCSSCTGQTMLTCQAGKHAAECCHGEQRVWQNVAFHQELEGHPGRTEHQGVRQDAFCFYNVLCCCWVRLGEAAHHAVLQKGRT